jgi:hypothetical protein
MKKCLLSLLFAAAFVSQSWAAWTACTGSYQGYCYWPPSASNSTGGCYEINKGETDALDCADEYNNCLNHSSVYRGVTYPSGTWGDGEKCENLGGTWIGTGNNPNFNGGVSIWCRWASSCYPIKTDEEKDKCIVDGSVYRNVPVSGVSSSEDDGKQCEGGTWTNEGRDPNRVKIGCCDWDGAGCFPVYDNGEWGDCSAEYRYNDCSVSGAGTGTCIGSPMGGGPSSAYQPSSNSWQPSSDSQSPIIKLSLPATSNIVKAINNGINVQLTGNAKVQVYDLKGNMARSLDLMQGSYNVELSNMPHGTYIVRVIGSSWKQSVTVPVK